MTEWWWGVPPVDGVPMPCAAGGHRAAWERGALQLPELDAEAEGVLAALGGSGCRCAEIGRAWGAHADDLRVLTLAARTADDQAHLDLDALRAVEQDRLASFERWRAHHQERTNGGGNDGVEVERWRSTFSLLLLLALPNVLQRRLVATVGWAVEQRWTSLDAVERAVVTAAMTGRVAPSLRASLVRSGAIDRNEAPIIDVQVGGPDVTPTVAATTTAAGLRLDVALGVGWLRAVWGADAALRGDAFVLEVTAAGPEAPRRGRAVSWGRAAGNTRVEPVVEEWENDVPPDGEPLS